MCKVRLTLRDKQLSGWKIFCDNNSNNYDDNSDDDDNNTNDDEDDDDDDDDSDDDGDDDGDDNNDIRPIQQLLWFILKNGDIIKQLFKPGSSKQFPYCYC